MPTRTIAAICGSTPTVLLVDDEDMVSTSIRAFLELETEFEIQGFTDPVEAARYVEAHPVDVALFHYLEKPWDNAQVLLVVRSDVERARLVRDLKEKVDQLDSAHASLKNVQRRLLQAFL